MEREPFDWKARVSSRRGVSHKGRLRCPDGRHFNVLVTNLSYSGCQVLAEGTLTVGQSVTLSLPGQGTQEAQVRWVAADSAGLQFLLGQSASEDRRARIGV